MDQTITRVDPVDCNCDTCGAGASVPINTADQATLQRVFEGRVHNASGLIVTGTRVSAVRLSSTHSSERV